MTKKSLSFLAACGLLACAATVRAELIYAVNGNNELLTFDSSAPSAILSRTAITGTGGEFISDIDFRPGNGQLYGLGENNNLFVIDFATGAASFVGATGVVANAPFGFDFNPVPDRIRLVSNDTTNFRLNPDTGAVANTDTNLFYVAGDANNGIAPQIAGAAYTNNFGPSPRTPPPGTELFYIDFNLEVLVFSPNPNLGELATRGSLNLGPGVDLSGLLGFDISGVTGVAFASLSLDGLTSSLYTIDLATGAATLAGGAIGLGTGETILDISAAPVPEPSTYALLGCAAAGLIAGRLRKIKTA